MFSTIRAKTLLAIIPLLLLTMITLSWVSYHYSAQIIQSEVSAKMTFQSELILKIFHASLSGPTAIGESIARFTEKGNNGITKSQYAAFLQNIIPTNPLILGAAYGLNLLHTRPMKNTLVLMLIKIKDKLSIQKNMKHLVMTTQLRIGIKMQLM